MPMNANRNTMKPAASLSTVLKGIQIDLSAGPDGPGALRVRTTRGKEAIESLISGLSEGKADAWPVDEWLRHALGAGDAVISVVAGPSDAAVGFVSFQAGSWSRQGDAAIQVDVDLVSAYLRGSHRGLGIGSLLRRTAVAQLVHGIDSIMALAADGQRVLEISLTSNSESPEGAAFAERFGRDLGAGLDRFRDQGWEISLSAEECGLKVQACGRSEPEARQCRR